MKSQTSLSITIRGLQVSFLGPQEVIERMLLSFAPGLLMRYYVMLQRVH